MTYTPTIYDWRNSIAPINQIVRSGGQAIAGGMTIGGASVENPEPGGRAELVMDFAPFATEAANLDASWTVSRILNGAVMRVRLWRTVQLVPEASLTVTDEGQTWASGEPWANDENWRANPFVPITAAAAKGAATFTADFSTLGRVLSLGHVVGFFLEGYDFAHVVMDIDYDDADEATVTVSPPLRRALTTSDTLLFRPTMLVTCLNGREVMGNFQSGRHMAMSSAKFAEFLV